jgi:hypothetical protein
MNFTEQLAIWAKGDAIQGKIMLGLGLFLLLGLIFMVKSDNALLKGMLIPLTLLTFINLGYGSFLSFSRPNHLKQTQEQYKVNPSEVITQELTKAKRDNKNYAVIKPIEIILLIVSALLYFAFSKEYYRGLSMGLMVFFVGTLLLDTLLHQRLKPYLTTLESLVRS